MARDATGEVPENVEKLQRLRDLVGRSANLRRLSDEDLFELPRLYRHACSLVAHLEASGRNPRLAAETRVLVGRAHALLYGTREERAEGLLARLFALLFVHSPRAVRAEWRLCSMSFALLYGLALVAWFAVSADLDLAPSLLRPDVVEAEIEQLQETAAGEPFRGNFTFGWGESPAAAGMVMFNNVGVGILFFASALVPPLYAYLLANNALMLGTYTAVAGHWGQAGAISSMLWCHGVLEIQAIVLAGTAGLCLVRAWVRPGPWTRRHALQRESRRALLLLAPTFPILFVSGLIEGFVTPHAPTAVRLAVAVGTGVLLLAWVLLAGRERPGAGRARA
jgi:uncharacterized membrane protein SpoIIM required for sporulation